MGDPRVAWSLSGSVVAVVADVVLHRGFDLVGAVSCYRVHRGLDGGVAWLGLCVDAPEETPVGALLLLGVAATVDTVPRRVEHAQPLLGLSGMPKLDGCVRSPVGDGTGRRTWVVVVLYFLSDLGLGRTLETVLEMVVDRVPIDPAIECFLELVALVLLPRGCWGPTLSNFVRLGQLHGAPPAGCCCPAGEKLG